MYKNLENIHYITAYEINLLCLGFVWAPKTNSVGINSPLEEILYELIYMVWLEENKEGPKLQNCLPPATTLP